MSGGDSHSGDLSRSFTLKVSRQKCQSWKLVEKQLNNFNLSQKFIALSQTRRLEHGQKKATMEAKKSSTTKPGESLHGVALIQPSTATMSLQHARHLFFPDVHACLCAIALFTGKVKECNRNVTSRPGVHSSAILGYFTIAVYGDWSMTSRNILNIHIQFKS